MSKAKDIIIQRTVHGKTSNVKLGSLSHNELCRGVVSLQQENQQLKQTLNFAYVSYANHLASQDALSKEEWLEYIGKPSA